MGLRESRIINSVHPWLGVRLKWLQEVALAVGGVQTLISGVRTREEQLFLYNRQTNRPAAYPGCSQHEYGFAADALWTPIVQVTSKARLKVFRQDETDRFMGSAARHVGLHLVANDTGHLQVYAGSEFKAWAVASGFCNPNPPPPDSSFIKPRTDFVFRTCGPGFSSVRFGLFGAECI